VLLNALTKPSEDRGGVKTKPRLTKREFIELVKADPTTRLNNIDIDTATSEQLSKVKAGKYVQWLIKSYLMPTTERQPGDNGYEKEVKQVKETFMEDLYKVTDDLKKFDRFKSRVKGEKDINKMTPNQLYDAVKDFDLTLATTTKAERKQAEVHPGSKLIYDGDNWKRHVSMVVTTLKQDGVRQHLVFRILKDISKMVLYMLSIILMMLM
jgi:hypothetical protein